MTQQNKHLKSMIIGFGAAGYAAPIFYPAKGFVRPVTFTRFTQQASLGKLQLLKIIQAFLMKLWA